MSSATTSNTNALANATPNPTSSPRRLAANRENAAKSTGPRTPAGKAASALNASSHSLFSANPLLPTESEQEFHLHRQSFLHTLDPRTAHELHHADRIVAIAWRLKRVQEAEWHLHHGYSHLLEERLKEHNQAAHDHQPPAFRPALLLATALADSARSPALDGRTTPHERLLAAENRLQGMMSRAYKELLTLQKHRRAQEQSDPDSGNASSPSPADDHDLCPCEHPNTPAGEGRRERPLPLLYSGEGRGEGTSQPPARHTAPQSATPPLPKLQNEPTRQNGSRPRRASQALHRAACAALTPLTNAPAAYTQTTPAAGAAAPHTPPPTTTAPPASSPPTP